MPALICGSVAYDTIMVFPDRFKNHILPEQVHILNVSFLVPEMRREYGGCAGNIAYNLHLLGETAFPMATVGKDFAPYAAWMDQCGIDRRYLTVIEESYTAQAFITTDQDDNQITAFHPGAMAFSHYNRADTAQGITIAMVSPDGRQGMIDHANQLAAASIPFIFDPGQGMPLFDGSDLRNFIKLATWAIFNDYEAQLLQERTGESVIAFAQQLAALIVTRGSQGATIYTQGKEIHIPAVPARKVVDPTGCGDAFRGGLLYGLMRNYDWETTGRIAALLATIKIEQPGTQNHRITREEIQHRFREAFGADFSL